MPRIRMLIQGAVLAAILASPAMAASEPSTRLVECRSGNCLRISGYRDDAGSAVSINGHVVPVEGGRKWRAHLPLDTVREWSAPLARTIKISVVDAAKRTETAAEADLPIGLLGHAENLALLAIRLK